MNVAIVITFLVGLSAVEVRPQCFTENDVAPKDVNTDLTGVFHIGAELYRVHDTQSNFFFSPHSIWSALSLTYLGARNETEAELQRALRLNGKMNTLSLIRLLQNVNAYRKNQGRNFTIDDANRIYVDDQLRIFPCVNNHLSDMIINRDIDGATAEAAQEINQFVSYTTRNKIQELVTSQDLELSQMVLVNAVYFKGNWTYQFERSDTRNRNFFVTPNSNPQSIPMMTQTTSLYTGRSQELSARILELPYSGDEIAMYILLPEQKGSAGWNTMVSGLSGDALRRVADRSLLTKRQVNVLLPRFKSEKKLDLGEALQRIGIKELFSRSFSDLSLFNPLLYVSKVIHKAVVEVNEEGTEAAAATAVITVTRSGGNRAVNFHCTRPFMYLIIDRLTKSLLFMGTYANPTL